LIANVVSGSENSNALQRWQVREVTISADPPQPVQVDGELLSKEPITARILPQAVRVIVPPVKET
jgi:diacylglycerol kinase family enzyme